MRDGARRAFGDDLRAIARKAPHKGSVTTIELLDGGRRFLDVGVLDDAVAAGAALAAGGDVHQRDGAALGKMPRSSSTEVDHGMLPTYRRLEGSSNAVLRLCVSCLRSEAQTATRSETIAIVCLGKSLRNSLLQSL